MYNRYLDDDSFVLLEPELQGPPGHQAAHHPGPGQPGQNHGQSQRQGQHQNRPGQPHPSGKPRPPELIRAKNDLLKDMTVGLSQLLDGLLQHFKLEDFDTGDILLVLIILFLYLEDGDNLELIITLGLLLLLGLDDGEAQG